MGKNTSISLDEHFESFIREQVGTGAYATASEVVRDALRRLEVEKKKEAYLLDAIDAGLASGRAEPGVFDRLAKKYGFEW